MTRVGFGRSATAALVLTLSIGCGSGTRGTGVDAGDADGFVPPPGACGTWRALYQGLAELEAETHEHIHVENNVLFAGLPA